MNLFGVGGPELIAILIIMLVFAGPKRMIHWSYLLGQYLAKFRAMWSQTVDLVQKEFDDAGVGIQLPKEPPTRKNMNKAIADVMEPVTQPVQESLDEVKKDVESLREVSAELKNKTKNSPSPAAKAKPAPKLPEAAGMGSWSGRKPAASAESNSDVDMGTWSSGAADE